MWIDHNKILKLTAETRDLITINPDGRNVTRILAEFFEAVSMMADHERKNGITTFERKYLVVKLEDIAKLSELSQHVLNMILKEVADVRTAAGKPTDNRYLVLNSSDSIDVEYLRTVLLNDISPGGASVKVCNIALMMLNAIRVVKERDRLAETWP